MLLILGSLCAMLSHSSRVLLFVTLWTVTHQAPLSSKKKNWSGLLCTSPEDLPDPGINSHLLSVLCWQTGSLPLASWETHFVHCIL